MLKKLMKKILVMVTLVLFLVPTLTFGEDWIKTDQAIVSWNPVTTLSDGTALPTGDVVNYTVYILKREPNSAPVVVASNLSDLQYIVILDQEGFFHVGIQALRYVMVDGVLDTEPIVSTNISWSSEIEVCLSGNTFGIRHHIPPGQVDGLAGQ